MRYIYKAPIKYSEVVHGYCSAHAQYVLRRLDASSAAEEAGLVRLRTAVSLVGACMGHRVEERSCAEAGRDE